MLLCCCWGIYKLVFYYEFLIIFIFWGFGFFLRKSRNNDIKSEKRCFLFVFGLFESVWYGGIGFDVFVGGEGFLE